MPLTEKQIAMLTGKLCPYCGKETEYVNSMKVYEKDYGMIYYCQPCAAWVGVHKGTNQAKGRLAKLGLRILKQEAHLYFDRIWKIKKLCSRSEAYAFLSQQLNIAPEYTHIGMFGEQTCLRVIAVSKKILTMDKMPENPIDINVPWPYQNIVQ